MNIVKKAIIEFLNKLPYVRGLYQEVIKYKKNSCYSAGHYYSPIFNIDEIKARENEIWSIDNKDHIHAIDFNLEKQKHLTRQLQQTYNLFPYTGKQVTDNKFRYCLENDYYSYGDGAILFSMIMHFKPSKIIEIGSGYSSALLLDLNEMFFDNKLDLTFVDPNPQRLLSLLREEDDSRQMIISNNVQDVPLRVFQELDQGDVLFIDSSHVVKTGSDVVFLLNKVLPILKPGVLIHFHDIFFPFEYPKEWVYSGRNWNENYFIQAFLMYNRSFEIVFYYDFLFRQHKNLFSEMPICFNHPGGNLWIRKIE